MKINILPALFLPFIFGTSFSTTGNGNQDKSGGLPAGGDTPADPHSAFTHLKNYPIDGGLVDGPVYTSVYNNLIGIKLYNDDEYKSFQSELAVYRDDYGNYSTNEPTMDGTACLIYLLAAQEATAKTNKQSK
jgi:endoglucanase